jgi:hypothetical protein
MRGRERGFRFGLGLERANAAAPQRCWIGDADAPSSAGKPVDTADLPTPAA